MVKKRTPNLENDISCLKEKTHDDDYAKALYASLCNMRWVHRKTGEQWSCTWRYAGGIIAGLRNVDENYMDFYCSGNEGKIRKDVYRDLCSLGWKPKPYPGDDVVLI